MILWWQRIYWLSPNFGPSPVFVWKSYGSPASHGDGSSGTKQFVGEIQQMGFGTSMDTSIGLT